MNQGLNIYMHFRFLCKRPINIANRPKQKCRPIFRSRFLKQTFKKRQLLQVKQLALKLVIERYSFEKMNGCLVKHPTQLLARVKRASKELFYWGCVDRLVEKLEQKKMEIFSCLLICFGWHDNKLATKVYLSKQRD